MLVHGIKEPSHSRRAAALLIAISVVVVLTIIVMALSTSVRMRLNDYLQVSHRAEADATIRVGLDVAARKLAAAGAGPALNPLVLELEDATCAIEAQPARKGDDYYVPGVMNWRPGDALVTIAAKPKDARRYPVIQHQYLLNVDQATSRTIRLSAGSGGEK